MRRIVVLTAGTGWHVQDLRRAAGLLGVELLDARFSEIEAIIAPNPRIRTGRHDLGECDAILLRMMPPASLERVVFRMDAIHRLAASGRPVVNPPRAMEAAIDKFLAIASLQAAGLPVPETWAGESPEAARSAFDRLGGDVVIKPIFGSEGRGMMRVSDPDLAARAFSTLSRLGAVLYLQEYVDAGARDLRAFVVGGRVVAAIRRTSASGEWRANLSRGGRAEVVRLGSEDENLAIRAAGVLGAEIAGVDLIESASGTLVVEVNAVPGWKGLSEATGLDVASEVLQYVASRC